MAVRGSFVPEAVVLPVYIVVEQLTTPAGVDPAAVGEGRRRWGPAPLAVLEAARVPAHAHLEAAAAGGARLAGSPARGRCGGKRLY